MFAPKVSFFLPGDTNFDTALFKNFPLKENFKLQLRVETYNTFNHSEFNGVNNTATFANANSQGPHQKSANASYLWTVQQHAQSAPYAVGFAS